MTSRRLDASALRRLFVDRATAKFARHVPDFVLLQALVREQGGTFRNDHGAIRVADARPRDLFVAAAAAMGLTRELDYEFPNKKLKSFDLQVPGEDPAQFKVFVSQVDLAAFPPAVAKLIADDCERQALAVDFAPLSALAEKASRDRGLPEGEAEEFVEWVTGKLMHRNGPPLLRSTLDAVAAVSGEAASALALGPDFNHITIDVHAAGFRGIEEMADAMQAHGFRMLPQIQGAPGTKLRQTATRAATVATPVREDDGRLSTALTEKQFVEIIERGPVPDGRGGTKIYRNFIAMNAENIFDAAATRVGGRR